LAIFDKFGVEHLVMKAVFYTVAAILSTDTVIAGSSVNNYVTKKSKQQA